MKKFQNFKVSKFQSLIFIIYLFCLPFQLKAVTKTWNPATASATNRLWSTGGSWLPTGAPTANDDVVFPSTVAQGRSCNVTGNRTCKSVTFGSGTTSFRLTFADNSSLTINGNITNASTWLEVIEKTSLNKTNTNIILATPASGDNQISGSFTVFNLEVNNTGGNADIVSGTLSIEGRLLLTAGNLDLTTTAVACSLRMWRPGTIPTPSQFRTPFIDPTGTNTVIGAGVANFVVSQYCPEHEDFNNILETEAPFNYRYFSSPINSLSWHTNLAKDPSSGPYELIPYHCPLIEVNPDVQAFSWCSMSYITPAQAFTRWYAPSNVWPNHGTPGFWRYDESLEDPDVNSEIGWYGHRGISSSTNLDYPITALLTHAAFGYDQSSSPREVYWRGEPNMQASRTGTFSYTTRYIDGTSPLVEESANGFHLIGNPYPFPISWDDIWNDTDNADFNPIIAVWQNVSDLSNVGENLYFDASDPCSVCPKILNEFNGNLSIGQGFKAFTLVNNNTLTIKRVHGLSNSNVPHWRKADINVSGITLQIKGANKDLKDNVFLKYGSQFENSFSKKHDFPKQKNSHINLAVKKGRYDLAVSKRKVPVKGDKELLSLSVLDAGFYSFHVNKFDISLDGTKPYLVDKKEKTVVELDENLNYGVNLTKGDQGSRFAIVFAENKQNAALYVGTNLVKFRINQIDDLVTIFGDDVVNSKVEVRVVDLNGKLLRIENVEFNSGKTTLSLTQLPKGIFMVQVLSAETMQSFKVVH